MPGPGEAGPPPGRTGGPIDGDPFTRDLPATADAVPAARAAVVDYATSLGASEELQWSVRLAVSEAVTNVVRHAYVGRDTGAVRIDARPDGDGVLLVVVEDDGIGPSPREDSPGSGFGLGLVAACTLSHELGAGPGGRGSRMVMRFALTA